MTRGGKRGKLKQRVSPSSHRAWKSGRPRRIPTFPQRRRRLLHRHNFQTTPAAVAVELGLREAARLELEEGEAGAVAQPVEPGEIVDEQLLLGGGGLPVGEQWLAEAVEGVGIIAGTLQGLAPEMFVAGKAAVLEGVEGGTLFALGGARAGGFAGGGAIGGQAFFGHLTFFRIGHGSCSLGF